MGVWWADYDNTEAAVLDQVTEVSSNLKLDKD